MFRVLPLVLLVALGACGSRSPTSPDTSGYGTAGSGSNDQCGSQNPCTLRGTIDAYGFIPYGFTLTRTGQMTVTLTWTNPAAQLSLYCFAVYLDTSYETVRVNSTTLRATFRLPAQQTVSVHVSNTNAASSNYTLTVSSQ